MKNLMIYEGFNRLKIESLCRKYGVKNYTINDDGTIDVIGNLNLSSSNFQYRIPLKFNKISGNFSCSSRRLDTLINSPKNVIGNFNCADNNLKTLLGGPEYVGGRYYQCNRNNLRDFYGFPENFFESIYFAGNPVEEILNLIDDDEALEFINLINDKMVIKKGDKFPDGKDIIIKDRLKDVLIEMGYELVVKMEERDIKFNHYELI